MELKARVLAGELAVWESIAISHELMAGTTLELAEIVGPERTPMIRRTMLEGVPK